MRTAGSLTLVLGMGAAVAGGAADFGWVGMSTTDSLVPIDLVAGTAQPSISLLPEGDYPYDVSIHPAAAEVWVCGASGDGVIVVDTTTATVLTRIDLTGVGDYPVDVAFESDGQTAWISSRDNDQIVLVDVATHVPTGTTIPIASSYLGPGKMALDGTTGNMFVVDWYGSQLHRVDPVSHVVTTEVVGTGLWDLKVAPNGAVVYVTDRGSDQVHVVDPETLAVLESVAVGDDPWGIDVTPDGKQIFVANEDSSNVTVIDTDTLTPVTVALVADADPRDVDISADGLFAYVPSGSIAGNDAVFVIDTETLGVVDTIDLGSSDANANAIAVAPEGSAQLFADDFESGDTQAWSATVP